MLSTRYSQYWLELVGRLQPESCGQWLYDQVEAHN